MFPTTGSECTVACLSGILDDITSDGKRHTAVAHTKTYDDQNTMVDTTLRVN